MDSARSWFLKRQPRGDKVKSPTSSKKNEMEGAMDIPKAPGDDVPSNATKLKVAAAKQYIESHYKAQMKCLEDRKERQLFLYFCWNMTFNLC